ncbi:hypothetical protein [Paenibacillus hexagrammi]|uniref:DUF2695 domain-containing protein n=1 Tax=Paenibacillus hexagrammi TaxID=2908839 RepID=A0ABY3SR11_9BACL|nr:hypothetical protein [Paenibacillus sp. YPD9-1]UJF35908.1 hypothetical protein L0M14_12980 [Paenibacillus sp. YPD9-1]
MMKYGDEPCEHRFLLTFKELEPRGQWLDLYLDLQAEPGSELPEDLADPSILVICNRAGHIVQVIMQDEGCDCEYQLTLYEKSRIEAFVQEQCQDRLAQLSK